MYFPALFHRRQRGSKTLMLANVPCDCLSSWCVIRIYILLANATWCTKQQINNQQQQKQQENKKFNLWGGVRWGLSQPINHLTDCTFHQSRLARLAAIWQPFFKYSRRPVPLSDERGRPVNQIERTQMELTLPSSPSRLSLHWSRPRGGSRRLSEMGMSWLAQDGLIFCIFPDCAVTWESERHTCAAHVSMHRWNDGLPSTAQTLGIMWYLLDSQALSISLLLFCAQNSLFPLSCTMAMYSDKVHNE